MSTAICSDSDLTTWLGIATVDTLARLAQANGEQNVKDFIGWQEILQADNGSGAGSWTEYYPSQQQSQLLEGDPKYTADAAYKRAVPLQFAPSPVISLRQLPVRSITNVWFDPTGFYGQVAGSFGASTLLASGTDYFLRTEQTGISWSGQLVRRTYWWPGAEGSLKVQYVSGFTAGELTGRFASIRQACLETIKDIYLRGKAIGLGQFPDMASESDGGGVTAGYRDPYMSGLPIPDRAAEMLQPFVNYSEFGL